MLLIHPCIFMTVKFCLWLVFWLREDNVNIAAADIQEAFPILTSISSLVVKHCLRSIVLLPGSIAASETEVLGIQDMFLLSLIVQALMKRIATTLISYLLVLWMYRSQSGFASTKLNYRNPRQILRPIY